MTSHRQPRPLAPGEVAAAGGDAAWWRSSSGRAIGAGLLALVALLYAPLFGRGFTSEDFLLIRVLRQAPPWADLPALFTEPWLGVEVVRFYRPVGELLLALEARWFAGDALPYTLVHTALHAVNVVLVWRVALRLAAGGGGVAARDPAQRVAVAAAVLFAVHPLHPNAVSWVASYATLFAATLLLAAWWSWEGLRTASGGGRSFWRWGVFLACFTGALGCYEAAVMLPAALALRETLLPAPRAGRGRRVLLTAVPGLVAAGYLLLRQRVLGAAVGGYASFSEDLLRGGPVRLAMDALTSLRRLVHPVYAPGWPRAVAWGVLALAFLLPAAYAWRQRRKGAEGATAENGGGGGGGGAIGVAGSLGWWAMGWAWALLFLAPFAFRPFVPANGRFAYLASVGVALSLAPLAGRLSASLLAASSPAASSPAASPRRRWSGAAALAVVAAIAIHWAVLFVPHATAMVRAGELAATVRNGLLEAASASSPSSSTAAPLLVAEHPLFVHGAGGDPRAQVLRYGLSDALGPPFVPAAVAPASPTYPLPPSPRPGGAAASASAAFAAAAVPARVLTWDGDAGAFRSSTPVSAPADVMAELTAGGTRVTARPAPGAARHRLLVLTRGNPTVVDLAPAPGGRLEVAAPLAFIRSMTRLYGDSDSDGDKGRTWWWVEATGPGGELVAVSPAREWPL